MTQTIPYIEINGIIQIEGFRSPNGKKQGLQRKFKNGKLVSEVTFQNGKEHGFERLYDDSGCLFFECPYDNGIPHGVQKEWDDDGNLEIETVFDNGEITSTTEY